MLTIYNQIHFKIYTKCIREISKSTKVKDLEKKLTNGLLKEMHKFLDMGEQRIKERKEALLSEVLWSVDFWIVAHF